jgi:hypothetical protein
LLAEEEVDDFGAAEAEVDACDSLLAELVEELEDVGEEGKEVARFDGLGSGAEESVAVSAARLERGLG